MSSNEFGNDYKQQHEKTSLQSCVLLLNGFPGVGKFTIAKALAAKLGDVPHRLIDNHVLIDPIEAIEPGRSEAHYALRKKFRVVAFEGLKALDEKTLVIILTACLATSSEDLSQFAEYLDIAEARGVPLVVVNIVCDVGTNRRRLCSSERKTGGKTKLIDVGILEKIRSEYTLLGKEQATECAKGRSMVHFELDTSEMDVEQASRKVWDFLHDAKTEKGFSNP
jgi:chloramphenicol 3-O-phosphotransferase